MSRYMYDAIHANITAIPTSAQMVAGYDTGSQDIRWVTSDWERFNESVRVHVDQANGGPVHTATVMDVETGAYGTRDIGPWVAACTAPRPTVYVSPANLATALAESHSDIWLASPGTSDAEALALMAAEPRIVAVQNIFANTYDRSIVGDEFWPERKPVEPEPTVKVVITWMGTAGLVSRKTEIPVSVWDTLKFESAD